MTNIYVIKSGVEQLVAPNWERHGTTAHARGSACAKVQWISKPATSITTAQLRAYASDPKAALKFCGTCAVDKIGAEEREALEFEIRTSKCDVCNFERTSAGTCGCDW